MDMACSMHGRSDKCIENLSKNLEGKHHGDIGEIGFIMLR
jgi:hypothetical protein